MCYNNNMQDEIWKPIDKIILKNGTECFFEGYEVSNYGRIRSYKQKYGRVANGNANRPLSKYPTIINGRPDKNGYIQYLLSDINKKRRNFRISTIMKQIFS